MTTSQTPSVPEGVSLTNQQVLVTGADGFIGSHVVERLLAAGARA